jgi:phenylacetate-CoA ligase
MTGAQVKKELQDIISINKNSEGKEIENIRNNYMSQLLKHAVTTTTFYKSIPFQEGITAFPIINKNTINNNYNAFKSQKYINKKTKIVATSGSTGTPLKIIQDTRKKNRNTADNLYFSELAGFKIGYKLFFLRHWNSTYKKSKLKYWLQNMVPIEVVNMNDKKIAKLIAHIDKQPSKIGFLGFPSSFEQICKYLDRINAKPIKSDVLSIIGIAEGLSTYTKDRMNYYFKAPMVSRYSNMENGILAQQKLQSGNEFMINYASYHIEILNLDNNEPAPNGTVGRIVVTDLFNYAMPLIRYDTSDLGLMNHECTPPTLLRIEGRMSDTIYDTKGNIVSSFMMTSIINYVGIKQIQLIQNGSKLYALKYNGDLTKSVKNKIMHDFKEFLGDDAFIELLKVNEIPLLDSGKQKITVNNYMK